MSILLQVNNLEKSYDVAPLFDGLTFSVDANKHIAVVGRNGAGKSTLFRVIMGEEMADSGDVQIHPDTRIGYLRQEDVDMDPDETVMAYLLKHTHKPEWACAKMAGQFDLKNEQLERTIGSYSGGYQMRIKLISMLLDEPNLLLLDEPTNYLDLSTLLLLERFLREFQGIFLLISHDREFLNRTCDQTLEIAHGKAVYFPQPLDAYLAHKATQEEFARRYNKKIAKEQRHLQAFVDRFRYKASKASQAQSKIKQIKKLKTMSVDSPLPTARIFLPPVDQRKGQALSLADVAIGYGETVVADDIRFAVDRGEHIAIVGDNGQGKTTLLKTIAGAISPLAGNVKLHPHVSMGYYAQHVPEMLDPRATVGSHLIDCAGTAVAEEAVMQMAGNFLFHDDDIQKPISVLSGGEKARLCLAGLLLQKHDVLLLDEPTSHLDFETVDALADALRESHVTLLFVSHDRAFVRAVASSVIEVGDGRVRRSHHNYDDYVYHLKERLSIREEQVPVVDEKQAKKQDRKVLYEQIRERKRLLQETEEVICDLEKEKQQLCRWFEQNATQYSPLKQDQLTGVQQELNDAEQVWFRTQQELEALEVELADLRE